MNTERAVEIVYDVLTLEEADGKLVALYLEHAGLLVTDQMTAEHAAVAEWVAAVGALSSDTQSCKRYVAAHYALIAAHLTSRGEPA